MAKKHVLKFYRLLTRLFRLVVVEQTECVAEEQNGKRHAEQRRKKNSTHFSLFFVCVCAECFSLIESHTQTIFFFQSQTFSLHCLRFARISMKFCIIFDIFRHFTMHTKVARKFSHEIRNFLRLFSTLFHLTSAREATRLTLAIITSKFSLFTPKMSSKHENFTFNDTTRIRKN